MSENRDAELAVIGCLMADPGTVPETMGIVREEDFQSRILRSIFRACRELFVSGEPVDPITVLNRLPDESRTDYKAIIVRAVETMPSTRGYADYARIVRQDGQKARAAALNGELMLSLSSGGSLEECQELAVKMCEVLSTTESGKSFSAESISMTTENKHVAKLYAKLIFQQIPMQTSVTTREYNGNFQQPTYAVSVDDGEDRKTILAFFGHRQGGGYNVELLEGEQARHAFLAGAMLSCSNISDPRKDYHLEFVLAGEQTALFLMQVLDSQIEKARSGVLDVENKAVLRRVLQSARKVVEQKQKDADTVTLRRWRDRRNRGAPISFSKLLTAWLTADWV